MAIADLVKSTLGPKGMDKILVSMGQGNHVTVTNDGATILKSIYVDNAAAKVLVDISKAQDDEVGDGTTSVVVFAGELLRQAEQLVNQKVHPMTIIQGFREACAAAREALALLGEALLHLGARARPEVRGALLVQHHAADRSAELLVVLVLVGQPVAGLELVAVAHLEGHLRLRLGEALVGENELIHLLLQGLLLERLETRLERLQTVLDDLLLRIGELVVVVVARARQQGVARDVRGRGVLVRGRGEGRLRHRDVSHGRLG